MSASVPMAASRSVSEPIVPCRGGQGERGFTLIEVMVALAVFSLAALALIRLEGATIRGTDALGRSLEAGLVARNVAIEAVTDARPPALGPATGVEVEGGHRWTWSRQVAPLGDGQVLRIDVVVADVRGQQLGRLTMIRPPTPAAQGAPA